MFITPGVFVGPHGQAWGQFCEVCDEQANVVPACGRFCFRRLRPTLPRTQSHGSEAEGRRGWFCKL